MRHGQRAFTLIELLVAIVIVAILLALALPSLGSARAVSRAVACGARLQQLGVATAIYVDESKGSLPQTAGPLALGGQGTTGTLFGGKRGRLPMLGHNEMGAERRPLNAYVRSDPVPRDDENVDFELEEFRSPVDNGAEELYLPMPEYSRTDSIYNLLGSSYVVNFHSLDGEAFRTLIPEQGGRMPYVQDPTRTWMLGSHSIYNYQHDSDRGERWYSPKKTEANLHFADGHGRIRIFVPDILCEVEDTTEDYTFLAVPGRISRP